MHTCIHSMQQSTCRGVEEWTEERTANKQTDKFDLLVTHSLTPSLTPLITLLCSHLQSQPDHVEAQQLMAGDVVAANEANLEG